MDHLRKFCFTLSFFIASIYCLTPAYAVDVAPVSVTDGSTYTLPDNAVIKATGASQSGIYISIPDGGTVKGGIVSIDVGGDSAYGIRTMTFQGSTLSDGNATVELGQTSIRANKTAVEAISSLASGSAGLKSEIHLGNNCDIYSAKNSALVANSAGSKITVGNNAVIIGNPTSTTGAAVTSAKGGIVEIGHHAVIGHNDDLDRGANGAAVISYNLPVYAPGYVKIGDDSTIFTKGDRFGSHAVKAGYLSLLVGASAEAAPGDVRIGDRANISTLGDEAFGLYAVSESSTLTIGKDAIISTQGEGASAIRAGDITSKYDITAGGGVITVGENAVVTTSGDRAYGLDARYDDSKIEIASETSIKTVGAEAHGVFASLGGAVELNGGSIDVDSSKGSLAIAAIDEDSSVSGGGVYNIRGDISAQQGASIALSLDAGSYFRGTASADADSTLSIKMNGGRWAVMEDSMLTHLDTDDNTEITFGDHGVAGALENPFLTLRAQKLSGSAVFKMRADVKEKISDRLFIEETLSGTHTLFVENRGDAAVDGTEKVRLVEAKDGTAGGNTFALEGDTVEFGAYKYTLGNGAGGYYTDGQYWELQGTKNPDPKIDPTPVKDKDKSASNTGSAAINTFAANYLLNYADMNTLIQRLGDLRDNAYNSGAWFRAYGGKFKSLEREYVHDFDMDYWGVQAGYDRKLEKSWFKNGDTYLGAFFSYGNADLDYLQYGHGNGEVKNKTLGLYATYMRNDGFYVDTIVKHVWSETSFNVLDSHGTMVTGKDVDTGGLGASIEVGKRFRFGKENNAKGSWYIEPQAQITWQHMGSGAFMASNGLCIGLDSYDSVLGRIGFLLGYQTNNTNFYAKASYMKEFNGDLNINANGVNIFETFDDNWFVYGIGVTHKINDRNSLYFDLERSTGGKFEQDWAINGGWRISF